jgi:hypothetical protein
MQIANDNVRFESKKTRQVPLVSGKTGVMRKAHAQEDFVPEKPSSNRHHRDKD